MESIVEKSKIIKISSIVIITIIIILLSYLIFVALRLNVKYSHFNSTISSSSIPLSVFIDDRISETINISIINDSIQENEIFHQIYYNKPITLIICLNDNESEIIFPLFKTVASGFAFSDNLVIINYQNTSNLGYTLKSIIKHELSHTLIKQNIKSFKSMMLDFSKKSLWFSEGIALYNQDHVIYQFDELKELLQDYSIEYYPESDNFHVKPQNYRLDYSLYYHFFYYLVEKYGKDKMINYMELMILDYKNGLNLYSDLFNTKIEAELNSFLIYRLGKNKQKWLTTASTGQRLLSRFLLRNNRANPLRGAGLPVKQMLDGRAIAR